MNLAFNGVMWTLFTKALTLSTSTVRVSVINTSANFVVTALLGAVIFGEELSGKFVALALFAQRSVHIILRCESNVEVPKDFGGLVLACSLLAVLSSGEERRRVIQGKVMKLSSRQQWPLRKDTRISPQVPAQMLVVIARGLRNGNADKQRLHEATAASTVQSVSLLSTDGLPTPFNFAIILSHSL